MNKLLFLLLTTGLLAGCNTANQNSSTTGSSPTPSISSTSTTISDSTFPSDSDTEFNNGSNQIVIPNGWTQAFDGALKIQLAYPSSWTLTPATSQQGELSVTSFVPKETSDTGGVPVSEIKVGITYFGPEDSRKITYQDSEIIDQTQTMVDRFSATTRDIRGGGGSSKTTEVKTPNGTYLISAYPLDSNHIDQYSQILNHISLDKKSPVVVNAPAMNTAIASPLTISGSMPGNWMNEASTKIELHMASGQIVASGRAQTSQNWMTAEPVDFTAKLNFSPSSSSSGFIYIFKSNPSGRPQNSLVFSWPVTFN